MEIAVVDLLVGMLWWVFLKERQLVFAALFSPVDRLRRILGRYVVFSFCGPPRLSVHPHLFV